MLFCYFFSDFMTVNQMVVGSSPTGGALAYLSAEMPTFLFLSFSNFLIFRCKNDKTSFMVNGSIPSVIAFQLFWEYRTSYLSFTLPGSFLKKAGKFLRNGTGVSLGMVADIL
jgi:hypothetical protein